MDIRESMPVEVSSFTHLDQDNSGICCCRVILVDSERKYKLFMRYAYLCCHRDELLVNPYFSLRQVLAN